MDTGVNRYRICLSLYGTTDRICAAMQESPQADLFEIRMDLSPGCDMERIRGLTRRPLLLTAHGNPELLNRWGHLADFVDVEQGKPLYPHSIVSYHGNDQDPEIVWEKLRGGEISKLVLETKNYSTIVRLLELNRSPHAVCFASGEEGRFSRILSLFYGALWSYVCLPDQPTGPGQFSLDEYINIYRMRRFEEFAGKRAAGERAFCPKVFGIMGDPVSHSGSPSYHNRRFQEEDLSWIYLPFRCRDAGALLRSAAGFGGAGFSITHPLKQAVLPWIVEKSNEVERLGSCNTVCLKDGKWHGTNTDEWGVRSLLESAGVSLEGKTFVIVGAGATARVVASVVRPCVRELVIMNRTKAKADLLASEFQARSVPLSGSEDLPYDILFHTTPVGLRENEMAVRPEFLRPGTVVFDAIYEPPLTPLLRKALSAGCRVVNGEQWFLAQAEAQIRWWQKMLNSRSQDDHEPRMGEDL